MTDVQALEAPATPDRRAYIGGSMIQSVLGLSPWEPAWAAYKKLRGEWRESDEERRHYLRGKMMEPVIVELFKFDHPGFQVEYPAKFVQGPKPYFGGTPDCYILKPTTGPAKRIGGELKSVNERNWRDWGPSGTDQAPAYYVAQCLWYMGMTGLDEWWILAQIGADDQRVYQIHRDNDVIRWMFERAEEFWQRVQTGDEPPLDATHPAALDAVKAAFGVSDTVSVTADEQLRHWRAVEHEARKTAAEYEKTADSAKAHLLRAMGDAAILDFGDERLTRKRVKRAGYIVSESEFIESRWVKPRGKKAEAETPLLESPQEPK